MSIVYMDAQDIQETIKIDKRSGDAYVFWESEQEIRAIIQVSVESETGFYQVSKSTYSKGSYAVNSFLTGYH